ncbi:MAG: FAD-dependent oxidoreductase [Clostridiales bacterium]|nr:FAD-dependent oxidoreductase [Clostridiales bacterium]
MEQTLQFNRIFDVVVLGAGTAGCAAALAAADEGKRVCVVEQLGGPGGSGSLGLVTPLMSTCIEGNPMCSYIGQEINGRMEREGFAIRGGTVFDPVMLTFVLEEMLHERGVTMMYHTFLADVERTENKITAAIVENKDGRGAVRGGVFIDATGDADVCVRAGLETLHGDEETGKNQPVSLRYVLGGIDCRAFWAFYQRFDLSARPYTPGYGSCAVTLRNNHARPLDPVFEEAVAAGDLTVEDGLYWQCFFVPGREDCIAFNCPEFFDIHDAAANDSLCQVQVQGKLAILRQLKFYRKYFEGFEHATVNTVSAFVGIRESRRAVTEHVVTAEECASHTKFPDAVCQSNYPIDVHGRKLNTYARVTRDADAPYFEVPFRALVVKGVDNLLVAGRNLGAEFMAQSAIRIIPTCRAMGEAAGLAAAMALNEGVALRELDGKRVHDRMTARGAHFAGMTETH